MIVRSLFLLRCETSELRDAFERHGYAVVIDGPGIFYRCAGTAITGARRVMENVWPDLAFGPCADVMRYGPSHFDAHHALYKSRTVEVELVEEPGRVHLLTITPVTALPVVECRVSRSVGAAR